MKKLFSFLKEENYQVILHKKGSFSALKNALLKPFILKDIDFYFSQEEMCFFIESFDQEKNFIFTQGKWNYFDYFLRDEIPFTFSVENIIYSPQKKEWKKACSHTIYHLNEDFSKVVLSGRIHFQTKNHPLEIFLALAKKYNEQKTFFINLNGNLWIGSTPETLLKVKEKKCESMALAGTFHTLPQYIDEKSHQEHEIVSSFIFNSFQKYCSSFERKNSFYMKLPHFYHLCTPFQGEIESSHLYFLLKDLHPTPALCGFPKNRALSWIQNIELSSRKFYGGFFGTLGKSTFESFVTIRCFEYSDKGSCTLYIGAGIVKQSDPQKEWEELMKKAETFHFLWETYARNT